MRRRFLVVFTIVFLITACGSPEMTQAVPPPTSSSPIQSNTSTQISSTATLTLRPAQSTFTPTFDAKTIVTATPESKAVCPTENPTAPDFETCEIGGCFPPDREMILNYLNSGGRLEGMKIGETVDVTGDGIKDLLVYSQGKFSVYGCNNGKYQSLWEFNGTQTTPHLDSVDDLNRDGIPELIIMNAERRAFRSIYIFAWNGKEFVSLIKRIVNDHVLDFVGGTAFEYKITDTNNDGVKEIVGFDNDLFICDSIPDIPSRVFTSTIVWDGNHYVVASSKPSSPVYRFQAIQDADYEVLNGQYEKALSLYQEVIFNDKLEWWSQGRREYEVYTMLHSCFDKDYRSYDISSTMTPTPYPTMPVAPPDITEYPRLAAYAYYRIMVLQVAQGNLADAKVAYETLEHQFSDNPYGSPYVEMAAIFWSNYQSSQNINIACNATIDYAVKQPDILIPLGSDYHGLQAKRYKPEDVCPF